MSNIDQLCILSRGNLFFIQQLCDIIEQREFPCNIDLPSTLNEIFYYRFLHEKIQKHIEICRAILEICLASRRPINLNVLYDCLNIDENFQVEWSIFLQVNSFCFLVIFLFFYFPFKNISYLSVFLTQFPNSTYAIIHGSVRNWLISNPNQYFSCDIK